jgi:hypothetical protein
MQNVTNVTIEEVQLKVLEAVLVSVGIKLINFDVDVGCASTLKAGGRRETASRSRAIYFCDQPDDVFDGSASHFCAPVPTFVQD